MIASIRALWQNNRQVVKYAKNTSWLLFDRVFLIAISMLMSIFIARYLRPINFGLLNYAFSFTALFSSLSSLGMDSIIIKRLISEIKSAPEILGTAMGLKFIGGICAALAIQAIALILNDDQTTRLILFFVSLPLVLNAFLVIDYFFQSQAKAKYAALARTVTTIIMSIARLLFIHLQAPITAFALLVVTEYVLLSVCLVLAYWKVAGRPNWGIHLTTARSLLNESWPLLLTGFMVSFYMRIDQVLIKNILGSESVGLYAVATKLSETWYFIPMAIVASVYPSLVATRKNTEKYRRRFSQLYFLLFWIAIPITISVSIMSQPIIRFLYGLEYLASAQVLSIHVLSTVFVFFGVATSSWLVIEGLQKYALINSIIGTVINIVLNIILLPRIGIAGAAYATLASYFFASYLALFMFKKTRQFFYDQTISPLNLNQFRLNMAK